MELFYEPLPRVFQDVRDLEVIVFDDEGYPIFQVELEEFA